MTVAMGMEVDIPSIRFVIHVSPTRSVREHMHQKEKKILTTIILLLFQITLHYFPSANSERNPFT